MICDGHHDLEGRERRADGNLQKGALRVLLELLEDQLL